MFNIGNSRDNKQDEEVLTTTKHVPEDTAQMSMKKGLRVYGKEGYTAVKKEMQQLHDQKVMQPINRKDLTTAQKRETLRYLMFVKKKRSGTIKGCRCADGCKQ